MDQVELLFLGSGTSAGIPMIGCHCEVCASSDPRDWRTRPSVVISSRDTRVLIDASPELRLQCVAHAVDMIDAVVCTHPHADHIMGLDDLRRFNALRGGPLDVWADSRTHEALNRCFGYAFDSGPAPEPKVFRPRLVARTIDGDFNIGPLRWHPIRLLHGGSYVLGFRIGALAYCTDVSKIPEEAFKSLESLDVLVLGALGPQKHPSHFSIEEAVEMARRIGAKQTLFTHVGHGLAHARTNEQLPRGMRLAFDGERVTARAEHSCR